MSEWYLKNIPKIAHFYWGNETISYMRYLTLFTFRKLNPDWFIYLHLPKQRSQHLKTWNTGEQCEFKGRDYFTELLKIENICVKYFDFNRIGISPDIPEVHKSDFIRWFMLSNPGGIWFDFDIIFFNPVEKLAENREVNFGIRNGLVMYAKSKIHAIGFLLSSPNSMLFRKIFEKSKIEYKSSDYQCIGSPLVYRVSADLNTEYILFDDKCVYPYRVYMNGGFEKLFQDIQLDEKVLKESIGIHWYGGDPKTAILENEITEDNIKGRKELISKYMEYSLNI